VRAAIRIAVSAMVALAPIGCGVGVSQLPEAWDRGDSNATADMEMQIKRAIFCELRKAARAARGGDSFKIAYHGVNVTSAADEPFPDSWGAQITLTLTVDEKTTLSPGLTIKDSLNPGLLRSQPVAQNFSFGLGGTLSKQNVRYDKFNFYYNAETLADVPSEGDICSTPISNLIGPHKLLGPRIIRSSPFVDASNLGIVDWLPGAVSVMAFQRSSRANKNGEGPALGSSGSFVADSATYDNKFIIVSSANATPSWSLVKVTTANSSLVDMNRTRTHELLITIGPGQTTETKDKKTGKLVVKNVGPSLAASQAHLASQIGSAVADAIRGQ
jgi:hypothetical protein